MKFLNVLKKDESGATAIEYGLIAGLIGLVLITAALAAGIELSSVFEDVAKGLATRVAV